MSQSVQARLLLPMLRYALLRWGAVPAAAAGLLVAAALVQYFGVLVPEAQALRLRAASDQALAQRLATPNPAAGPSTEALRATRFHQQLPDATQALQSLAYLHQSAARHGVALPSAQYQVTWVARATPQGFKKTTLVMPVRATYPALRAWLADVLNTQGAIALDELSLQRASADTEVLEARVRLTLFAADGP